MLYFLIIGLLISLLRINNTDGSSEVANGNNNVSFGIVTFLNNEHDILPGWLRYHSSFTPLQNIVILDNNSTEPTIGTLRAWEKKGIRVLYEQGPYSEKGTLTIKAVREYLAHVDVIIPLDADEILTAFDGQEPIFKKSFMLERLKEFSESNHSCWALQQYFPSKVYSSNETLENIQYFNRTEYSVHNAKKIVKNQDLVGLDHGSHHPTIRGRKPCESALGKLGLLHYHNRSPKLTVLRALTAVNGYGLLPEKITLETLPNYREFFQNYINHEPKLQHIHKFQELLLFLDHGYVRFQNVQKKETDRIGTWNNIVNQMSSSSV